MVAYNPSTKISGMWPLNLISAELVALYLKDIYHLHAVRNNAFVPWAITQIPLTYRCVYTLKRHSRMDRYYICNKLQICSKHKPYQGTLTNISNTGAQILVHIGWIGIIQEYCNFYIVVTWPTHVNTLKHTNYAFTT